MCARRRNDLDKTLELLSILPREEEDRTLAKDGEVEERETRRLERG